MDVRILEISINGQPLAEQALGLEASGLQEWAPIEVVVAPVATARDASLTLGGVALGPPSTTPFDPRWRWVWQPGGIAGLVQGALAVELADGARLDQQFLLRLLPRAIDEQTFGALLREVRELGSSVALRLGGQALQGALLVPSDEHSRAPLEEALALVQRHGRMLAATVEALARRPWQTLREAPRHLRLAEAEDLSELDVRDLWRGPLDLTPPGEREGEVLKVLRGATGGPLPPEVTLSRSSATLDVPEHRFAAWLVLDVGRRARRIRGLAEAALGAQGLEGRLSPASIAALETLRSQAGRLARDMDQLRASPLLSGLKPLARPPRGQLLRRDQRYRPLLASWRELRASPMTTLDLPLLLLPIASLPALYEGWAALTTAQLLSELGTVRSQSLLSALDDGWSLRLQRDQPLLELDVGAQRVRLRYQPRYAPDAGAGPRPGSLDRYLRVPDLSVEVEHGDELSVIVLDAKYRLAPDGYAPQDALDDVYAYKGSIGRLGQPCVRYAAVLYPGRRPAETYGEIGAVALLPGATGELREILRGLLEE